MDLRFELSRVIYTGPRSVVCSGRDRMTGSKVAVKMSKNAGQEVDNLMRTLECDSLKVVRLVMKRPVEPRELSIEGLRYDEELRSRGWSEQTAVVTDLHDPVRVYPPECVDDDDAAAAMLPYFSSVAELHARSTLDAHCDVKFSNFVSPRASAPTGRCLVDFELAQQHAFTGRNRKRGTPVYMAPETLLWGEVNPAVDSWALGVMLFQACHPDRTHPFLDHNDIHPREMCAAMDETRYTADMWMNERAPLSADLVARLLDHRIWLRMRPEDALSHPLFTAGQ